MLRADGVLYVQEPLAEGAFFELMRPVDDETRVRDAAQAALGRAAAGPTLVELARREAVSPMRLADFEALRRLMVSVEPSRAVALDAQAPALRAAFEHLGPPAEGGAQFEQPVASTCLLRGGRGPADTWSDIRARSW